MARTPSFASQLNIEWTVEFLAKRSDDLAGFHPLGLLGEIDLALTFNYWGDERDGFDWELVEVSHKWTHPFKDDVVLTRKSDPEMFTIINRSVSADAKLEELLLETIREREAA